LYCGFAGHELVVIWHEVAEADGGFWEEPGAVPAVALCTTCPFDVNDAVT
jgi:hypothetical protein